MQTAKVRTGDLVVTASGAGTVVPTHSLILACTSGVLTESKHKAVGDRCRLRKCCAGLEENIQAES
ncbi:MAG: hypothetical protein IPN96_18075 [Anaerolineales bacterium]|nr:hypothetical protein [Anaerolineales bacterium]